MVPFSHRIADLSGWRARFAACGLGILLTLAFAPFYAFPAAFVAFSLYFLLVESRDTPKSAFAMGWWFGLGHHVTGLYWICIAMGVDNGAFLWMIPFSLLLLPAYLALFTGLAAWATVKLGRKGRLQRVLLFSAFWVLAEIGREKFLYGFPWNNLGYVASAWLPMMQGAAWVGVYGMSLWLVLLSVSFVLARNQRPAFLAICGLSVLIVAGGLWRLQTQFTTENRPTVRIVQGNIPQSLKWDPRLQMQALQTHVDLTTQPGHPDYIVWPETAMPYPFETGSDWAVALGNVVPEGSTLITGVLRSNYNREHLKMWNGLQALNRTGEVTAFYNKNVLVPFGEFVPLRQFLAPFGLNKITPGTTDFSRGEGAKLIEIGGKAPHVQPLICYETIFPSYRTPGTGIQPDWLLNLTNDAWFGTSSGPYQHLEMARMRAVERGAPMVRAANTGISVAFDPLGRELGRLPLNRSGKLDVVLPERLFAPTWYSEKGDSTVLIVILLMVTASLLRRPDFT